MFKLPAKTIMFLIGFVLLILLGWWIVATLVGSKGARTEARLSKNQVEAATRSGEDAVNTVGDQISAEDRVDAITRENERDIRNAEGADAPVNPAARAAGLRSLCKRTVNKQRPECLQLVTP